MSMSIVLRLGQDFNQGEGCVTQVVGIEGGEPDEAVDAPFGLQVAVGPGAVDLQRHALDAGLFSGREVQDTSRAALGVTPTEIHAHEGLRPVLGLGATGPGVDSDQGSIAVVLSVQGEVEFKAL